LPRGMKTSGTSAIAERNTMSETPSHLWGAFIQFTLVSWAFEPNLRNGACLTKLPGSGPNQTESPHSEVERSSLRLDPRVLKREPAEWGAPSS
jgi:hypothetical protein